MPGNNTGFTRRDFIKTAGVAGVALGAATSGLSLTSCKNNINATDDTGKNLPAPEVYPIASTVNTTLQSIIAFDKNVTGLAPQEMSHVAEYDKYGYGK